MIAPAEVIERVGPEILAEIGEEVRLVELELRTNVSSQVKLVHEVGRHTLDAGGKRLRPALVVLAARATGLQFDAARARKLGACMEMVHMATLIHDDVIDHSATRRGKPTAAAVFGNTASILSGDVLLSRAMAILAQDGDLGIIRQVASAVVELAEGEVMELEARGDFALSREDHYAILRMKTASFIEACCRVGAMVAGASAEAADALGGYGHHLGLAFQIVDDLLDYQGDPAKTGKPQATDFKEGCMTMPLISLRDQAGLDSIEGFGDASSDVSQVLSLLAHQGAFERTREIAVSHVQQAVSSLGALPDSKDRSLLEGVAQFVLERQA
jgi:octaprenyl-diphosphate synthase